MKWLLIALFLSGCGNDAFKYAEDYVATSAEETHEFNSEFIGRIRYKDGTPYAHGSTRAVSEEWSSYVMTNENGEFIIPVIGDSRFILSALSPYENNVYYEYKIPLVVPEYDSGASYECEYNIEIITCYENNNIVR